MLERTLEAQPTRRSRDLSPRGPPAAVTLGNAVTSWSVRHGWTVFPPAVSGEGPRRILGKSPLKRENSLGRRWRATFGSDGRAFARTSPRSKRFSCCEGFALAPRPHVPPGPLGHSGRGQPRATALTSCAGRCVTQLCVLVSVSWSQPRSPSGMLQRGPACHQARRAGRSAGIHRSAKPVSPGYGVRRRPCPTSHFATARAVVAAPRSPASGSRS